MKNPRVRSNFVTPQNLNYQGAYRSSLDVLLNMIDAKKRLQTSAKRKV